MIVIQRKLLRSVPYTAVFFPAPDAIEKIAANLGAMHFARFFWVASEPKLRCGIIRRDMTATVCIDLNNSREALWGAVSKNGRNEIRTAERLGERVRIEGNNPQVEKDFLSIYQAFSVAKAGVAQIDASVLRRYAKYTDIFLAYLDDQPMCGHVFLRDAALGRARLLYSASRRLEDLATSRLCGNLNRFLHWHEMLAYREDGLTTYDFGGIREDKNDGIARFKSSFGGAVSREFTYLCSGSRGVGAIARLFLENVRRRRRPVAAVEPPRLKTIPSEGPAVERSWRLGDSQR
jgi:hypothetical protein